MAENLEADVKVLELSTNLVGTIYNKENAFSGQCGTLQRFVDISK